MNLNKSTRYALYAAMEMARAGPDAQVTAAQVAERYAVSATVLAKVFQRLVRAGIAVGTRGTRGGYSLAGKPSEVTVLDVIDAFETPRTGDRVRHEESTLQKLFDEVDEMARCTFASVTLETLVGTRPGRNLDLRIVK